MHLAYVCADPGIPVFGTKGASVHVQEVLAVLLGAGHTVELFCRRTGGQPWPEAAAAVAQGRLVVHRLEQVAGPDAGARESALLAADVHLRAAIDAAGPFDAVYERYALWSRAGTAHARANGIPAVLEVNAPLPQEQAAHRGLVHAAEAAAVIRDAATAATAVVCVSGPVADWVKAQLPDDAATRVVVEANGVDPHRIVPRPAAVTGAPAPAGEPFTVGFVGTLKPWHGTATLLTAFALLRAEVPHAELLLVGDGPEAGALQAQAADLGIGEATTFAGPVAPSDVPGWLHRMDVATAPYPAGGPMYFSPLKVYEYLAAALPVVASAVGELPEAIDEGRTGFLVPGSDPVALAAVLARLAGSPELRERVGRAGRSSVLAARTWTHVVDRSLRAADLDLHGGDGHAADLGARAGVVAELVSS